jgi:hypothetical protein
MGTKATAKAIRKYIMIGMTTSEKLHKLKQTQPNIDSIIQTCISFRNIVTGKKNASDIDTSLNLAYDCNCPKLASFAECIRADKDAIKNTDLTNYSNGIMEGTVNKIKVIKSSMFNRAGVELLSAKAIYRGYYPSKLTKKQRYSLFHFSFLSSIITIILHIKRTIITLV